MITAAAPDINFEDVQRILQAGTVQQSTEPGFAFGKSVQEGSLSLLRETSVASSQEGSLSLLQETSVASSQEGSLSLLREITDLGEANYRLNQPIKFLITFEDREYNGYYKPLEIYTLCQTLPGIESEIKADIISLYEELAHTPNGQLGEETKRWKAHLNEIISV